MAKEPMSPKEIAEATRKPVGSIKQLLFEMNVAGTVVKMKRGRYVHSDRKDLIERDD